MPGLRGIIRETEEYGLNRELILDRLRELVTQIVLHQEYYDENSFAYRELREILGQEVEK